MAGQPEAEVLHLDLKLGFTQLDVPQVRQGAGVMSWERLGVKFTRAEPLARRIDLAGIELSSPNSGRAPH